MRPMLHPGMLRVWRSPDTVQFGVDVASPIVVSGVDDLEAELLLALDGSWTTAQVLERAVAAGHDRDQVIATLTTLVRAGAVIDAARWPGGRQLTLAARQRLEPDLRARTLPATATTDGVEVTRRASMAGVRIHGVGRLGAVLATSLTAAGIGRVDLVDDRDIEHADVCAGGHHPADVGRSRTSLAERLEPWQATTRRIRHCQLDVVTDAVDAQVLTTQLGRDQLPHLVVSVRESIGRIGPLVRPGRSACLRCFDLTRTDLDPGWPPIAVQRAAAIGAGACDGLLVQATAAVTVMHVIDWLADGHPPSVNGVVELIRPHATMLTRGLAPHPACGCRWAVPSAQETMAS